MSLADDHRTSHGNGLLVCPFLILYSCHTVLMGLRKTSRNCFESFSDKIQAPQL